MLTTRQKQLLGPIFPIANKLRFFLLRFKYAGNKVYCPCCKSTFREFAPFSAIKKKNSWCMKCMSLERDRLLWMYYQNKTDLYSKSLSLLHIAPETIFFRHFSKQKNINYYPADIYPDLYPKGTHYFNLLKPDLPLNSFDVIICNHVFQYIEDDKAAMKNVYDLLKPGGWAILQVPLDRSREVTYEDSSIIDPKEREKAFGLKEHVRFYGLDYADKLRTAGFNVNVDDYTAEFSGADNFKFGFWQGDAVYYCTK